MNVDFTRQAGKIFVCWGRLVAAVVWSWRATPTFFSLSICSPVWYCTTILFLHVIDQNVFKINIQPIQHQLQNINKCGTVYSILNVLRSSSILNCKTVMVIVTREPWLVVEQYSIMEDWGNLGTSDYIYFWTGEYIMLGMTSMTPASDVGSGMTSLTWHLWNEHTANFPWHH